MFNSNSDSEENIDNSLERKVKQEVEVNKKEEVMMNTVMSIPPPRAMNTKENQVENWKVFREQWENFEIAADLTSKKDPQRVAILKACMGDDCFRVLTQLKVTDLNRGTVKGILDALEAYFKPKVNTRYERFVFNTARQEDEESIESYVGRLRELIKSCAYAANEEDDFVCDRLIPGIYSNEMRKKLLMTEDLTLQKAIEACKLIEQTTVRMKNMSNPYKEAEQEKH